MDGKIDGVEGRDWLVERLGLVKGRPLDYRAVARACFKLDPVSLVHGVFFAQQKWPWQPKIARAVTSFIEASGARPAVSGGVKRDVVINEAEPGATAKGYGTVPHHRVEYTAEKITAYFTVDHAQFRSYGLSSRRPRCSRRWPTSRSRRCSTVACGCAPGATSWCRRSAASGRTPAKPPSGSRSSPPTARTN